MRRSMNAVWLMLLLAIATATVAKAQEGYFGLTVDVDGTGFFLNPTITTATIKKVAAGSPAATAGIVAGDEILEVEGHAVPGAKADSIAPLMEKGVGQSLTLKLRRSSGAAYSVTLVAIARPQIERG